MTMLPDAPAVIAFRHEPDAPLAFARVGGDGGHGWYLIHRKSLCVTAILGPFETESEALAEGQKRIAAAEAVRASKVARRAERQNQG